MQFLCQTERVERDPPKHLFCPEFEPFRKDWSVTPCFLASALVHTKPLNAL